MPQIVTLTAQQIQKACESLGDERKLLDVNEVPRAATVAELEQDIKAYLRAKFNEYEDRKHFRTRAVVPFD